MKHLREEDFAEFLVDDKDPKLDSTFCEQCIADLERTRTQIAGARDDIATAAERDEIFWARQRTAIRERIKPTGFRLQWAASLAGLIIIAALLVGFTDNVPQQTIPGNQPDPDYVLLAQIQQTLARPLPNAVEPVRVLTSDMDQAWRAHLEQARTPKQRSTRR